MSSKRELRFVYAAPPTLDLVLKEFLDSQTETPEGLELLAEINQAKMEYSDGSGHDEGSIQYQLVCNGFPDKDVYRWAYVHYMGITLHYNDVKNLDAAWFYYARAQHCLGICDSWGKVLDRLFLKDLEQQNRGKGGRAKNQKHSGPLIEALAKIAREKKPPDGWKNKTELFKAAESTLIAIINSYDDASISVHDNLQESVFRWLRAGTDARLAYAENSASTNKDGDFFRD